MQRRTVAYLTGNVLVLSVVSLLADMSTEMIQPLLPLFLVGVLGASYSIIGLIFGSADSITSIVKVFSGWYSDRFRKRKPFTVGGYAPTAFLKPLLYLAQTPLQVFAIWVSDRFGKGVRGAPRDALIADSVDKKDLGKAFGFHRAFDTLGAVIGSFLGFVFLSIIAGNVSQTYRTIFVISSLPAIVSVVVGQAFVREIPITEAAKKEKRSFFAGIRSFDSRLKFFLFASSIFALANFNLAFFILKAKNAGIGNTTVVLLYVLFNIVYAAVSYPSGSLADRIGRKNVVMISYAAFILTTLGFAFVSIPASVGFAGILLFGSLGVYMGIFDGAQKAYVSEIANPSYKATALGMFATLSGIIALPASSLAGVLWDVFGATTAFEFAAIVALIALFSFLVYEKLFGRAQSR